MIHCQPTTLPGVVMIEGSVHRDDRGYFLELFNAEQFAQAGLPTFFAQSNYSHSVRGTLRGLHYQLEQPQGKLVRPLSGCIFDVVVDVRRSSPHFGQWVGVTLDAGDGRALYVPPGFAHGFLVQSDVADLWYQCTTTYHHASDRALVWNDPDIAIAWPLHGQVPLLSAKDAAAPTIRTATVYP